MRRAVEEQSRRKNRARREPQHNVWYGFGYFGLIGWAVAVPTLIGVAIGAWLDRVMPGGRSWTLALLLAGVSVGCLNAWFWLGRERKDMDRDKESNDEQ